jgi:hypothetical protein
VTDPNLFSQNTADFHYRGLFFFSGSSHTPNLFSQNTADFHYRGLFFFSSSSHTPNLFSQNTADFHYRGLFDVIYGWCSGVCVLLLQLAGTEVLQLTGSDTGCNRGIGATD